MKICEGLPEACIQSRNWVTLLLQVRDGLEDTAASLILSLKKLRLVSSAASAPHFRQGRSELNEVAYGIEMRVGDATRNV